MEYTSEMLEQIESYAYGMMTVSETSSLLGFDESAFNDDVNTIGNPARKAFMRGAARIAYKIRGIIFESASAGSPYAIEECLKVIHAMSRNLSV